MSVAKINTVGRAQKDQGECAKCKTPLPAGSPYRWYSVGFRAKYKHKRCMENACTPRPSERESSSKAGPMAAIEDFEAMSFDNIEDVTTAFEDVKSAFEEYYQECENALDAWENGNSQLEERRDGAQEALDTMENWDAEEYDGEVDEEGQPEDEDEYRTFLDDQISAATSAMNDAEGCWM